MAELDYDPTRLEENRARIAAHREEVAMTTNLPKTIAGLDQISAQLRKSVAGGYVGEYNPWREQARKELSTLESALTHLREKEATVRENAELRRERDEIKEALAGTDYASLPSDYPLVRMAHTIRKDHDKFRDQVIATCKRAETAERERDEAAALLKDIQKDLIDRAKVAGEESVELGGGIWQRLCVAIRARSGEGGK